MGLVVFFTGMYALTLESDSELIRRAGTVLGCLLVLYFILNNNTIIYRQHLTNQRDMFMANRIIAKMQSLEGYQPGMELAIVGRIPKQEELSTAGNRNLNTFFKDIKRCSLNRYSLTKSPFQTDSRKYAFLLDYMDVELERCGLRKLERLRNMLKNRKPWPDPSSVFIQEETLILVLSVPEVPPIPVRD